MRTYFLIFSALLFTQMAWAQPTNDECATAEHLFLSTPDACPNESAIDDVFTYTNVGATPTSPYPMFPSCSGGAFAALANEVWFTFTATSNTLDITVNNGLATPNIALFSGNDCQFLNPIDCAVANPNAGTVTLTTSAVLEGATYFILVSGGDVNDNSDFDLTFSSYNDCTPCLFQNSFTATPPPVNGTFSSGQDITFCYTVEAWLGNGATIEWLHSLEVVLGPGWDVSSFNPMPPPSCDGQGSWDWYPNQWTSCATGELFGPGFAYDSSQGVGCGGSANDGDPGNNWGDGANSGCDNIGIDSPVKTFCWTVTVPDCPPSVNGADLSMSAIVHSDGESGSWTQIGCNSGVSFNFIASSVCCTDGDPILIEVVNETCPGANNGSVTLIGNGDPGTTWVYTLFDQSGQQVVGQDPITSDAQVTFSGLAPGNNYSVLVQNPAAGCNRNVNFDILDGSPPSGSASVNEPCPGDLFNLMGSTSDIGVTTYQWTGPGGFSSSLQNPTATDEGTYTLVVTVDGCAGAPVTVDASFVNINVSIEANDTDVCYGDNVILTGVGADTYDWTDADTGAALGSGSPLTVAVLKSPFNILLTGYDANNCPDTDEITITINPPPNLGVDIPNVLCENESFFVQAFGADIYLWGDAPAEGPNREFILPAGDYQYELQGTDLISGCDTIIDVEFTVTPTPTIVITPDDPELCSGDDVTLTASGANVYDWVNGPSNSATYTVSPTETTTYTVMGTDFDGCSGSASVTVYVIDPILAPQVVCGDNTPSSVQFTWPAVVGATNYNVTVSTGQSGVLDTSGDPVTYTVTGLNPGESVTINVTTIGGGLCGEASSGAVTCSAQNCPPITVDVSTPVTGVCLDGNEMNVDLEVTISNGGATGTTVWSGTGVVDTAEGIFNPTTAGVGAHVITATYTEGDCVYTGSATINVTNSPTATFVIDDNAICLTETATVTYTGSASATATYDWDFDGAMINGSGQGPYMLTWTTSGTKNISLTVTENGCEASFSTSLTLDDPLTAPIVNCGIPTTTSVSFNWLDVVGASGYSVNVLSGQSGTMTGNVFMVNDLEPEEVVQVEVFAESANNCPDTSTVFTCVAAACPSFGLTLSSSDNNICLESNTDVVSLSVVVTGGAGDGTATWSGTGVTDAQNGIFDPTIAGAGDHIITLTYEEGPCVQSNTIIITVFDKPLADFSLTSSNVCIDELVTANYTGGADINTATFNWTFGGGNANPGSGGGPQDISWTTAGEQTVTLVVEQNGCVSTPVMHTVTVEAPLSTPVINCNSSVDEIIFTWEAVENATGYDVTVLTGQSGTQGALSYTVSNLSVLEEVEIQVTALGSGACGDSEPSSLSCVAEDCPDVMINIAEPQPICLDGNTSLLPLEATITGGLGNGTLLWTGDGVDEVNSTFDPEIAGPGAHVLNLKYTEGNCNYNASVVIDVFALPVAGFTMPDSICVDGIVSVVFIGNAGAGATYNWDFDSGMIVSGANEGPYEISWPSSGMKTVSLVVIENGCSSIAYSADILVEDPIAVPIITCETTENSIVFSWEDVPGAYDYNVIGPQGDLSGNNYAVTGLSPGTSVSITVEALTNNSCGLVASTQECFASDCPEMTVSATGPTDLCEGETANIELSFSDNSTGPFEVLYSYNGTETTVLLAIGTPIVLEDVSEDVDFNIISFTDISNPLCSYPSSADWQIAVHPELSTGVALDPVNFCQGDGELVHLEELLQGNDSGGMWVQIPGQSVAGFDGATGTFDAANIAAGTYSFIYQIDNIAPCVDHETTVTVVVDPLPNVDAGEDQNLFCNIGMITLGSSNTDAGTYNWSVDNPEVIISDPSSLFIDASLAGTYTLEVTNEFGCVSEDEVTVTVQDDVPSAEVSVTNVTCFGDDNGAIIFNNPTGGTPPYQYSLNDGDLVFSGVFSNLSPGIYTVRIQDSNQCFSELEFNVTESDELIVRLLPQIAGEEPYIIESGDSIALEITIPASTIVDTIIWSPKEFVSKEESSTSAVVSPTETTTFSVTVIDVNGCSDSDDVTIFVSKNRDLYVPNAFSPNGDGVNDILYVQSGLNVAKVNNFTVFNRWGESVFSKSDFLTNDPNFGWDGRYRGQLMNAAVFVYSIEVEYTDGKVEVFSGETVLIR